MAREVYADLDVNGNKVINVATPVAGTDATNKTYVDGAIGTRVLVLDLLETVPPATPVGTLIFRRET
jgi:hypothetical protein